MRPLDPRLRAVPGVPGYLAVVSGSAVLSAILIVAQASGLAVVIAAGVAGHFDRAALGLALGAAAARALLHAATGVFASRTAAAVKARLRRDVLERATARGPIWLAEARAGELATLVARGVDALDGYLVGYLPQLMLSASVPIAVLLRIAWADPSSAIIIGVTLPLLPIFAILVGWQTQTRTQRQWRLLSTLGGHFLDMLNGVATLRAFGRARAQVEVVRSMANRYRTATMATLRLAFLSALVLELIATVGVALVAVPVGLRLLDGSLTLPVALVVLLLAPEAYAPLRAAGAAFHASQEGVQAAVDVFAVIDADPDPVPDPGVVPDLGVEGGVGAPKAKTSARVPDPATADLVFDRVSVRCLTDVSFTVRAGEAVALIGPSGGGKSTILALLLGFLPPESGRILIGGVDLSTLDVDAWRARLAWVPQRPHLFAASVADNIRLGSADTSDEAVAAAARAAHATAFIDTLPQSAATVLGERGYGLSSGQRQRIALARAFLRIDSDPGAVVLLDEPTARLDTQSEAAVLSASAELVTGRTALLVAHRRALLPLADRVLRVDGGTVRGVPLPANEPVPATRAREVSA